MLSRALADAKTVLAGSSTPAELNAAREKLTGASHKLAEAMYKSSSANPPTDGSASATGTTEHGSALTGPATAAAKDEGVIDAEYVDVEEKK